MNKKYLSFFLLGLFAFSVFGVGIVSAQERGVDRQVTSPKWFVNFINFFGLGEVWSQVIVSIAILAMIFAAAYGILEFTAFETEWVKYVIAGAIAATTAAVRGVAAISGVLMALAGGSIIIATFASIVVAAFFFFLSSVAKSKMKRRRYQMQAEEVEGLSEMAGAAAAGDLAKAQKLLTQAKKARK
jgi:hypothetical protein